MTTQDFSRLARSFEESPWYERASRESNQRPLNPVARETALRDFTRELHTNPELSDFAAARGLDTGPFYLMGAWVRGPVIAYPFAGGIKFRDTQTNKRWMRGRFREHPLNIYYGSEPYARVLVAESETDTAALIRLYPEVDVALMPLGARVWTDIWTAQLANYEQVLIALDNDQAGEAGAVNIGAAVPQAARFAAPGEVKDWSEWVAANGTRNPPLDLSSSYRKRRDDETTLFSGESAGPIRTRRLVSALGTTTNRRVVRPAARIQVMRDDHDEAGS
jgi:hypothetical protein